jgi:hypothetical protein
MSGSARDLVPQQRGPAVAAGREDVVDSCGPSPFDAILTAVGVGLLVWGITSAELGLSALGGVTLFLGLVLPARWLVRYVVRTRRATRRTRDAELSQPLSPALSPATARGARGAPAARHPGRRRTNVSAP